MLNNNTTKKELEQALKEGITQELENAVNNLFIKYQNQLGINSGDIEPLQACRLEELTSQLSNLIYEVLDFELSTNRIKDAG